LVNDMLDASRIQSGRLEIRRQRCDLAMLAREVAEAFREVSAAHRIELELPRQEIDVACDAGRIEQVLTNLLDNAIKYSPGGSIIRVALRRDGAFAHLAVEDRGVGIDLVEQSRVFESYFRGRDSIQGKVRGIGLGLFVSKTIVDAHGGRIWVDSTPGVGSTFHVELPAEPTDSRDASDLASATRGP
jgi:signal transduction histidine kinase